LPENGGKMIKACPFYSLGEKSNRHLVWMARSSLNGAQSGLQLRPMDIHTLKKGIINEVKRINL